MHLRVLKNIAATKSSVGVLSAVSPHVLADAASGGGHGDSGAHGSSWGKGWSGSDSSSHKASKSSTAAPGTRGATVDVSGSTHGHTEAVAYGAGSVRVVTIPKGEPFAGRTYGGGTRVTVYGTQ